jgi:hypothetical protein
MPDPLSIHIDLAATDEQKQSQAPLLDICPHCGGQTEHGFGLAGGGYGVYAFCADDACGKYFGKIQVEE